MIIRILLLSPILSVKDRINSASLPGQHEGRWDATIEEILNFYYYPNKQLISAIFKKIFSLTKNHSSRNLLLKIYVWVRVWYWQILARSIDELIWSQNQSWTEIFLMIILRLQGWEFLQSIIYQSGIAMCKLSLSSHQHCNCHMTRIFCRCNLVKYNI